jgi:hypothetical protein
MAGNTQFTLNLTPTALGAFSVEISLASNDADENPYDWTISGTAFGVPEINVIRGGVNILDGGTDALGGGHQAGQAVTLTYNIGNIGTAPLTLTVPVIIVGPNNCVVTATTQPAATVAPSATEQLVLSVTPSGAGTFSFSISFANNDSDESPYNFTANGTALAGGGSGGSGGEAGGGCKAGAAAAPAVLALSGLAARRRRRS